MRNLNNSLSYNAVHAVQSPSRPNTITLLLILLSLLLMSKRNL